jgi:hypothetical protein
LSRERQREATTAMTEAEIRMLYETREPAVFLNLASNPHTTVDLLRGVESMSMGEIAEQVALFFRLGPGSGIEYAITEQR